MVNSAASGESNNKEGNQQITKRFAYQGKQYSSNPWQKFGGTSENEFNIQNTKFKKENDWLMKNKNDAQNKNKKGFDLDRVWSIRNDVAVVPTKIQYNKNNTYYSRHKKQVNDEITGPATISNDAANKSWNARQSNHVFGKQSFSNTHQAKTATQNNTDEDEFNHETSGNAMHATREVSARTARVQKYHNAYLKSNGLGQFSALPNRFASNEDEFP